MSCGFSKELLALHAEGDLSGARAEMTSSHLRMCEDCRRFLDQLGATQSLLKSLRSETIRPSVFSPMRRDVMSIIEGRRDGLTWAGLHLGTSRATGATRAWKASTCFTPS